MEAKTENLKGKQPVVVIVGHIDHGKTSILDFIRKTHVAEKEVGGITQHIGAYEIQRDGKKITFIDTPGHEAFSAMRARGAKVADIAILVVAADEGIQPQTKEAILHIMKAKIPMIVALNKVDKPTAQPERVKDELAKYDVLVETRGGKIPSVEVSAKTGKGISDLLDLILLIVEVEKLKSDTSDQAQGVIIESNMDSKRGPIASLILESGVLKEGDIIGTPFCLGKIKRLEDCWGKKIENAFPGQPVSVLGFEKIPAIGETFKVFPTSELAQEGLGKKEESVPFLSPTQPDQKILNLIVKTDVVGSIEPIEQIIKTIPQDKVFLRILKRDAGDVNLSDIKIAETEKSLILGFRVKTSDVIMEAAKRKGIRILTFDLIYDLVEGIRTFMEKTLASETIRTDHGKLEVLVIFRTEKNRQIVGAKVLEGEILRGLKMEILRGGDLMGHGKIVGLERDKREIEKGVKRDEVGILYEGNVKIQEKDILVAYDEKRQKIQL